MKLVDINFAPDDKELIKFGKTMIIGFSIIALVVYFFFGAPRIAIGCVVFGIISFILSRFGKKAMIVYLPWMAFGFVMGTIVSNLILAFLFFGLITPIGLFFKLIKRDMLHKSHDKNLTSYWHDAANRENDGVTEYQRQF